MVTLNVILNNYYSEKSTTWMCLHADQVLYRIYMLWCIAKIGILVNQLRDKTENFMHQKILLPPQRLATEASCTNSGIHMWVSFGIGPFPFRYRKRGVRGRN